MKKTPFFLVSQVLSFRHTKRTSKNVADTTFKLIEHIQVTTDSTSTGMTNVFRAKSYERFIMIMSNLRKKNFTEQIKAPIFLEAVLAVETT